MQALKPPLAPTSDGSGDKADRDCKAPLYSDWKSQGRARAAQQYENGPHCCLSAVDFTCSSEAMVPKRGLEPPRPLRR